MVTPENRQQDTPIQTPDNHVPLYNPYPRLDQSPSLSETL